MLRVTIGFADQALLSLFGLLLTVYGATTLSSSDFGIFAVVYGGYIIGLAISRAFTGEVLIVAEPAPGGAPVRGSYDERCALQVSACMAALAGAVVAVCVSRWAGAGAAFGAGTAVCAAILLDTARFIHIARRGLGRLTLGDAGAPSLLLVLLLVHRGPLSLPAFFAVWAGLCAVGVLLLLGGAGVGLRWERGFVQWFRDNLHRSGFFVTEALSSSIGYQAAVLAVVAVVGTEIAAGLRGAQVFAGPAGVLFLGAITVLTRECVERSDRGAALLPRITVLSVALSMLVLLLGALVTTDFLGVPAALLDGEWSVVRPFVWPAMGYAAFSMLNLTPTILLRARGSYAASLRARAATSLLLVVLALSVSPLGALEAAWAMALANGAGVLVFWHGLLHSPDALSPTEETA